MKPNRLNIPEPPAFVREMILKDLGGSSEVFNMPESISFNIILRGKFNCRHTARNGYLNLNGGSSIGGSILVSGDTSSCPKTKAIQKCARAVVKHLAKAYKTERKFTHLKIPDFLAPKLKKTSFKNIAFLKDAWRIGNFRSVYFDNFSIYLFPLKENRKKQKETIIEELTKIGWNYFPSKRSSDNNLLAFSKSKNEFFLPQIKIYLPVDDNKFDTIFGNQKCEEIFGRFVYAIGNKHRFTAKEAEKFKKFDFHSYICCVSFRHLKQAEIRKIFNRVFNDKNASFNTLKNLYYNIRRKNIIKKLGDKRGKLLIKMGDILKKQINKPNSPKQILELVTLIKEGNKYSLEKHPAFVHFRDRIVKVKLRYEPELKKYVANNITVSGNKSPIIIEISNIGKSKDKRFVVVSRSKIDNKVTMLEVITATMSISMSEDNIKDVGQYIILHNLSKKNQVSSNGALAPGVKFVGVPPDSLGIFVDYQSKNDLFEFNIIFKEK